jgi:hypothetical protein
MGDSRYVLLYTAKALLFMIRSWLPMYQENSTVPGEAAAALLADKFTDAASKTTLAEVAGLISYQQ